MGKEAVYYSCMGFGLFVADRNTAASNLPVVDPYTVMEVLWGARVHLTLSTFSLTVPVMVVLTTHLTEDAF